MNKIYGVAHGHLVGLFHDWPVAQAAVAGCPNNRYRSFEPDAARDAYRFVYGQPWPGEGEPLVVCHPDGWAVLVDPSGDVATQIAAGAPTAPGSPSEDQALGDGTAAGLRRALIADGVRARGGAGALLAAVDRATAEGRLDSRAAARLRRTVREMAR